MSQGVETPIRDKLLCCCLAVRVHLCTRCTGILLYTGLLLPPCVSQVFSLAYMFISRQSSSLVTSAVLYFACLWRVLSYWCVEAARAQGPMVGSAPYQHLSRS